MPFRLVSAFRPPFAGLRRKRRNGAVRPHDDGSPLVPGELCLSTVQSVLAVIVMDISGSAGLGGEAFLNVEIQPLMLLFHTGRHFCVGIEFFPGEILWPLQRSDGVVGPYSLQI